MSAGGLAGAIGMFGVMAGAVMGGPKAGRAALTKLGKSLKGGKADDAYQALKGGSKSADEGVTSAKKLARESDDFTQGGSASDALIGKSRAQDETDYFQQAVEKAESRGQLTAGQKVGAAARREAEAAAREGGSASITRFLSTSGAKQANTLQKRGQRWRDAKQEKGAFKTLMDASGGKQRRMIGDIAADTAQEAAATLPMSYAADSAMGLTGAPSDEEFYDVGAQTEAAVEYLPTFAAYEVAGRAALGGVGAALQGAGKAASKYMSGPEGTGIAKTVSNAFTAISDTAKSMGKAGSEAETRLNQRVRGSGSTAEMVKRGYEQAGKYMTDRKGALKDPASRRLARGDSKVKRNPAETSSTLRGAKQLFDRESGRNAITEMAVGSSGRPEDEAVAALQDVKSTLFKEGDQPRSRVARMLGGDAVSYGELKRSNIEMAEETQRQMKSIKQGLDDARRQVEAEAGNVTNNKAAGLIGSMAEEGAEGLRVSGYMKKGGEVMRVPTGQDARAGAAKLFNRATSFRNPLSGSERSGFSIGEVMGLGTFEKRTAAVEPVEGALPIRQRGKNGGLQDRMAYFGSLGDGSAPKDAVGQDNLYERGLAVRQKGGMTSTQLYGQSEWSSAFVGHFQHKTTDMVDESGRALYQTPMPVLIDAYHQESEYVGSRKGIQLVLLELESGEDRIIHAYLRYPTVWPFFPVGASPSPYSHTSESASSFSADSTIECR